jgi:hypothetical protein
VPAGNPDDPDVLEALGDEIATLAAHIHAATHRLLALLAKFDARRGWERDGHRSCAHWLSFRTGIDLGAAREKVRAARALASLPETSAAMARGELSFSQVRALTRVATAEDEADLVELARGCTTAQLERVVRGWRRRTCCDEATWEQERHDSRTLSLFHGDDGMVVVRGRLEPEVGALLMRAIEAAADALYREEHGWERTAVEAGRSDRGCDGSPPDGDTLTAASRRRADAMALVAERALAAGFGHEAPVSGARATRYQVVLHVDELVLSEVVGQAGAGGADGPAAADAGGRTAPRGHLALGAACRSHFDDGTHVSAETSQRISCDAALVRVTHGPDGSVLGVGRRTRTIPPSLRRALEARDQGCRFPGCGSRFCDAHHVRHWGQGGETSLANTLLLCRHHHRLVHERGWRVSWGATGEPVFIDPRGGAHYDARPLPRTLPPDPVAALVAAHQACGVAPDWATAGVRWRWAG